METTAKTVELWGSEKNAPVKSGRCIALNMSFDHRDGVDRKLNNCILLLFC